MRKQTKLVAVLSAAALLAIGASMTSFAAGWEKDEAGIWHYYDSDDEMVTGEWKKDGGKWFYLDDDGEMATDQWVDDEYYVGDDGAMLINTWKKTIADEDIDDPDEDGESWYYFGSKGKKTTGDKKISGKTYYFDTDGKMEDGWYSIGSDVYYLGGEDEGWRAEGWLWLEKPDDDDALVCDDSCTICDEEGWYYFGSNGKMYKDYKKKKVNGRFYFFNEHGQMLYEWVNGSKIAPTAGTPSNGQLDGNVATPGIYNIGDMIYTNDVEEGWRADGWYEIDGSKSVGTSDDTDWYYFKDGAAKKANTTSDGVTDSSSSVIIDNDLNSIFRARIKIEGKYFCFNEKGQMETGLQYIPANRGFYFFDDNGYMKTGKSSNVEEDNDTFTYYFITKNGSNGKGQMGPKDNYLYFAGKRLQADDDYKLFLVEDEVYLVNNKGKIQKSASKKYDIEGIGEDVTVTFTGSKVATVGGSAVITKNTAGNITNLDSAVEIPKIELYDHTYTYDNTASYSLGWQ